MRRRTSRGGTLAFGGQAGDAELARQVGLNPDAMLRQVGLNPKHLADPDTPISAVATIRLLEASAAASGVEDFALRIVKARGPWNPLGPISVVMREAETAREAIDGLCRYMRFLNSVLLAQVEEHDDVLVVRLQVLADVREPVRQMTEGSVGVLFRTLSELLGPARQPRRVCFEHRPPHGRTVHKTMFGSVEFNASFNGTCSTTDLHATLATPDSRMAPYARRFLDQAVSSDESSADNVRRVIIALLVSGRCTADQVAKMSGIDRRTLHRHLLAEGTSFSSLLREVRSEVAARHISDSDQPLAEVADLLGFSTPSAFAYWFKRTFGMTASEWKQCHGRGSTRDRRSLPNAALPPR